MLGELKVRDGWYIVGDRERLETGYRWRGCLRYYTSIPAPQNKDVYFDCLSWLFVGYADRQWRTVPATLVLGDDYLGHYASLAVAEIITDRSGQWVIADMPDSPVLARRHI